VLAGPANSTIYGFLQQFPETRVRTIKYSQRGADGHRPAQFGI